MVFKKGKRRKKKHPEKGQTGVELTSNQSINLTDTNYSTV